MRTLLSADQIRTRVQEIGRQITQDYAGREPTLIGVLKGSFVFLADLCRAIDLPLRIEFLGVRSYGAATRSSGVVEITQDLGVSVVDRDLIIVEDIVDSGLTSHFLIETLTARQPRSIKLCTLLHKPGCARCQVSIDYLGFAIDDRFVVGYGLDFDQQHRSLPEIAVLPPRQPGSPPVR
jgi:hypoxanthine phosphoribosyltransferase